jgi:hypothetical protein
MMKQTQVFLLPADEADFSLALRARRNSVRFVDDNVWPTAAPVVRDSVSSCVTGFAFLWDSTLVPTLPTRTRSDGTHEGPTVGLVVQVVRSRLTDETLLSGRIAASTPDETRSHLETAMRAFISDVWKALEAVTTKGLMAVHPTTGEVIREHVPEYRVGFHAANWVTKSPSHRLRDRSTQVFFRPRQK